MTTEVAVTVGLFWHVHHDILLEWCYNYQERANYIRSDKPRDEQELRLRLFKPMQGELPREVQETWQAYDVARRAHDEARQAYREAWQAYLKAYREAGQAYREARQAYREARQAYREARQAYREARQAYDEAERSYVEALQKHQPAIEALHAKECTNCPWDGSTIFSRQ